MIRSWLAVVLLLFLAGCDQKTAEAPPEPAALTREAVGHYCGMILDDHPGPKGQIFVTGKSEPVWFSSARDTIAFTLLPDEPKDIRAIYVTDMARAETWERPGPKSWMDARQALYVIESNRRGGMGQMEAVPFSDRAAAENFATTNGGRVVAFADIPRDYILGSDTPAAAQHEGH